MGRKSIAFGAAALFVAATALSGPVAAPAAAREIEVDDNAVAPGSFNGKASFVPWSSDWWDQVGAKMSKGWNGTTQDFSWNATTKQYQLQNPTKAVNDRSPLRKYDEFVRLKYGTDPQSALLELKGDDAYVFSHHVDPEDAAKLDADGVSYSWWGHCNGWAAACLLEREPWGNITKNGVLFEVADLKALLAETFFGTAADFTGRRYNKPKPEWTTLRTQGQTLLQKLNSGTPAPKAEYVTWYEAAWETTLTQAQKDAMTVQSFKPYLEQYESWYKGAYDDAFKDLDPGVFHKILLTQMGRKQQALVFDTSANEEVWNFPAYSYETTIVDRGTVTDAGTSRKKFSCTTRVRFATDGVSQSIMGTNDFWNTYTYDLFCNTSTNKIVRGEWTGSSVNTHPDFAWAPTYNPDGADYDENYKLEWGKIKEILPTSDSYAETKAVELRVQTPSGIVASSSRRTPEDSTTWSQRVYLVGNPVVFSSTIASGYGVTKVKYYRQPHGVTGSTVTSARGAQWFLGESTVGPSFASNATYSAVGDKWIVAYAYDSTGKLLGMDELAINWAASGSTPPPTGTDDAYEENDSTAAAKTIAAGTYNDLRCNDDDWYKVDVASAATLTVRMDFSHAEGDLDMFVYDGAGAERGRSEGTGNSETVTVSGATGSFKVRAFGYSGAKAKYNLTVTVSGGGPAPTDDAFEQNDTKATASTLARPSTNNGLHCKDDDWYKVTVSAGATLKVRVKFRHADGDVDSVMQDANGSQVAASEGTTDEELMQITAPAGGATYSIRVFGYAGATNRYDLILE